MMKIDDNDPAIVRGARDRGLWLRAALASLVGLAALVVLHIEGRFIESRQMPWLIWILLQPAWCVLFAHRVGRSPTHERLSTWVPILSLCLLLLLHLFSSAVYHKWFFFDRWFPEDEHLIRAGVVRLAVFTAVGTLLLVVFRRRRFALPAGIFLLAVQATSLIHFWRETGDRVLYRIDHPSFLLRLHEFAEAFPQLVNYMPYWNGGVVHYAGTPSGVAGPGLLLWPLWHAFPVHDAYNLGVAFLFIILVPWLGVFSVRAAGGDRPASFAGGILALCVSQHYFLWTLHYGTIGAGLSAAMVMPVCALAFRAVRLRRLGLGAGVALVLSAFCLLLWPANVLVGLGLVLAVLVNIRRLTRRVALRGLLCLVLVLALFLPWIRVLLTAGREAVDFVAQTPADTLAPLVVLEQGARHLLAHLREGNPVLLFIGVFGLLADRRRGLRRWYLPILLVLAAFAGWTTQFQPRSEMSRMSIAFFFAAVTPAAIYIGRLLRARDLRFAPFQAFILALLILTGWNHTRMFGNRGLAPYTVKEHPVPELVEWIQANVPEDGRLLFAGRAVHAYGRGKIAYLPLLTGREMLADDYYGFPVGMIEYEYPPRPYRASLEGLKTFFDAYNATHVITYHQEPWIRYFREHPDTFTERFGIDSYRNEIRIFEIARASSLVSGAQAHVEARFNRLHVRFEEPPPEQAVLHYNWVPGLRVEPPAEIRPHPVTDSITLIAMRPNGLREIKIRYHAPPLVRNRSAIPGE